MNADKGGMRQMLRGMRAALREQAMFLEEVGDWT